MNYSEQCHHPVSLGRLTLIDVSNHASFDTWPALWPTWQLGADLSLVLQEISLLQCFSSCVPSGKAGNKCLNPSSDNEVSLSWRLEFGPRCQILGSSAFPTLRVQNPVSCRLVMVTCRDREKPSESVLTKSSQRNAVLHQTTYSVYS